MVDALAQPVRTQVCQYGCGHNDGRRCLLLSGSRGREPLTDCCCCGRATKAMSVSDAGLRCNASGMRRCRALYAVSDGLLGSVRHASGAPKGSFVVVAAWRLIGGRQ